MARTRQSAKKSTGGSAPRSSWRDQKTSSLVHKESRAQLREKLRDQVKAKAVLASEKAFDITEYSENFCCICLNGGNLLVCGKCPRVACEDCIPGLASFNSQPSPGLRIWICPPCHISKDRMSGSGYSPYYGFYDVQGLQLEPAFSQPLEIKGTNQATLASHVSTLPTLILHFVLTSIFTSGSPASAFAEYLKPYFVGSILVFEEFVFNLNSLAGQTAHLEAVAKFLACISSSISRVFVFVTTHSDNNSGELFVEENGRALLHEFASEVITEDVLEFCKAKASSMFFLACGSFVNNKDALAALRELALKYQFIDTIAFTASGLQSTMTASFFLEYAQSVVLEGFPTRNVLQSLLSSSRALTRHSNIIHIVTTKKDSQLMMKAYKFIWSHKTIRPNGHNLPVQCGVCKSVGSWRCEPIEKDGSIAVACKGRIGERSCTNRTIVPKLGGQRVDVSKAGSWIEQAI